MIDPASFPSPKRLRECSDDCAAMVDVMAYCDCGALVSRTLDEKLFASAMYEAFQKALNARFHPRPVEVATLGVRLIDTRPCDPIEPDPNPVCVTEDDLT